MAFKGDTTPIKLQLTLTNYAEGLESKRRYHVRQISFLITTLEDECGADDVLDYAQFLNAEDQEVLSWQAGTEKFQNDVEVRSTLTELTGKLCPYTNISFSFFGKVTDCDAHQRRTGPRPFSDYRHSTFRSVMLTQHSAADGQVQLLYSCDGLPVDRSCLRWRSHDYIKLEFQKERSSYRVFWLVQWDVIDMTDFMNEGHVATGLGAGLGDNYGGLSLDPSASRSQGGDSQKFKGIRFRKERPSPYTVQIRPKGSRDRIYLGSYKTREAAALAADCGLHHFGRDGLNYSDSPKFLQKIPPGVNDEEKKKLVKDQALQMAKLAEMPAWIAEHPSKKRKTKGFTSRNSGVSSGSDNMRLATKASLPTPDGVTISSMETKLDDLRPSTSFHTVVRQETVGIWPEQEIPSTLTNWFTTNSEVSPGVSCPERVQEGMREPTLPPVFNVFSYPAQNSVPDISYDMAEHSLTDITCGGIPDANDSSLHHELERQMASTGYDSSQLVAEPEEAEPNGDWGYWYLVDWILNE